MEGFVTWEVLREYVSFVTIVFMVVEFTKELPIIKKMNTKYFSAMIAFLMILAVNMRDSQFEIWDIIPFILSAISISLGSNGLSSFNKKKDKII